ncbi:MAG: hypothetical protein OXU73_01130 [Candidatus Campbellbacteria bacterium]|nr:hypothetical protein [Candidatus Campbellbacteria bacterium]
MKTSTIFYIIGFVILAIILFFITIFILVFRDISDPANYEMIDRTDKEIEEVGEVIIANPLVERAIEIETEKECLDEGGKWTWLNAFFMGCVLSYEDGGKECSENSECSSGSCIAKNFRDQKSGKGICKTTTSNQGCQGLIDSDVIECLYDDILYRCTEDSTERECTELQ